ncbi:MAG: ferredoxin-thioredoxin reductase catalytic domain-containing protein [Promethearchaeota archaeon]|jgi:ferredoxin-thioredoxin reductase catalytic subunit
METYEGMLEYIKQVSKKNDWILNKDQKTLNDLIEGLVENKKKHGYQSCPCRLASGVRDLDRDLICPCDYAPLDIKDHGACYCNLYMRKNFYESIGEEYVIVPERRPIEKEKAVLEHFNK